MKIGTSIAAAMLMAALFIGTVSAETSTITSDGTVPAVSLSVTVAQGCENLALDRGTTVECCDVATVTANADWQLSVSDNRLDFAIPGFDATYRGYMTWDGAGALARLTYPFQLELDSGTFDLRSGPQVIIADGIVQTPSDPAEEVQVCYSQRVSGSEAAGDFKIQLTYTVSARI